MPRPPAKSNPDVLNYLQVRIPGYLKNEVIQRCKELDCTLNAWMTQVLISALREQKGLPEPPQAVVPRPTAAEEFAAWATGEQILTPCGRLGSCSGLTDEPIRLDGMEFCKECSIRLDEG